MEGRTVFSARYESRLISPQTHYYYLADEQVFSVEPRYIMVKPGGEEGIQLPWKSGEELLGGRGKQIQLHYGHTCSGIGGHARER